MLNENIRAIRKSKGLSQEELAIKLNVVRQTISKWEQGLSVPDSDMLLAISEALETPVSTLLGETVAARRNGCRDEGRGPERDLPEAGGHQPAAGTAEGHASENTPRCVHCTLWGGHTHFRGLICVEQSILKLGLQRP